MNWKELLRSMIPTPADVKRGASEWLQKNGKFWGASVLMHVLVLVGLGVAIGAPSAAKKLLTELVSVEAEIDTAIEESPITHFEVGETPIEPTVLNTESLTEPPATIEQEAQFNDNSAIFEEAGGGVAANASVSLSGLGGFDVKAFGDGPAVRGPGGVGVGVGTSDKGGSGGAGEGLGGRGTGSRQAMLSSGGGTAETERAVSGGLNWLARHQNSDGGWSTKGYDKLCKDPSCSNHNANEYAMAGVAFGLLPYFAAGQTHQSKGPYQATINKGLIWMTQHQDQKPGQNQGKLGGTMYEHGLATIALCEAFALTHDQRLRPAAQEAINFIQRAQHPKTGGWRYNPGEEGDTSVVGWQLMALKSAQMGGLNVSKTTLDKAKLFLKSCSKGKGGGLFSYTPESGPTPTMSAVGLLCNQYMGMKKDDPAMVEGKNYVMAHLPAAYPNSYYWYYATQVMHNLPGPEWDTWNRNTRRVLLANQEKSGCAEGSWNPAGQQGHNAGGRIMVTSIHALSLEVYYRYLPLYQIDKKEDMLTKAE